MSEQAKFPEETLIKVKVEVDTTELDQALEKAKLLKTMMDEINDSAATLKG